jgi:ABC-type transport system involved in multi-copper enzyme maturation permease subunit
VAIVAGYALAACFPPRRRLGLLLPAAGALLFGLLVHVLDEPAAQGLASVAGPGLFGVVLPVGCLVVGDAVLGAEVRSGTLHFTWLSPVGFGTIAAGRFLAGWMVAVAAVALPCAAAAVVAGAPGAAVPMGVATGVAAAAYVAVFVMVGATARRAVVWSLALVVLVERLLGTALSGVAQWCPSWLGRAVYAGLASGAESLQRKGLPQGSAGVVRLALLTAVALALATWRLRRLRLAGPSGD